MPECRAQDRHSFARFAIVVPTFFVVVRTRGIYILFSTSVCKFNDVHASHLSVRDA